MLHLILMVGASGSGKSTWIAKNEPHASVHSADAFFVDPDGVYKFNPVKLGDAHGACLRGVVRDLLAGDPFSATPAEKRIVVDNTNTTVAELAPYVALGQAYGARMTIIMVTCPATVAAARGKHGVSLEATQGMMKRISELRIPPFWPVEIVTVDGTTSDGMAP